MMKLRCQDNSFGVCRLVGSVRGGQAALYIEGGDEWAHLTAKQAAHAAKWLMRVAGEIERGTGKRQLGKREMGKREGEE